MSYATTSSTELDDHKKMAQWFEDMVSTLRTHEVMLETNTADEKTRHLYHTLIEGNVDEISHLTRMAAQKHFFTKLLFGFMHLIDLEKLNKLAFDFNHSELLAWIEIPTDDEALERELILAEAQVNAEHHRYGFHLQTTIVEEEDKLLIPSHYQIVKQ